MKHLYLVRGLPGAGKSTFAKTLAVAIGGFHFEADDYHMKSDGNGGVFYDWKPENVHAAHQWCQGLADYTMRRGDPVVISNTSTTEKELQPYLDMAETHGYSVASLIVEHRHSGQNVHNVPPEVIEKMRDRFSIKL